MREESFLVNDTKVYTFLNENLNSFCISLYVRAGSIFENYDNNGVTHLFEHIIFRNIKSKYTENFYDLLTQNGLIFSGTTYKEFVRFAVTGPVFGYDFACEVICGVFDELIISNAEYQLEKKRIKAEIRERNDRYSAGNFFLRNIWSDTNNDKTILGYCKNLDKISLQKLTEYRKQILNSENCFFYVTGNVDHSSISNLLKRIQELNIEKGGIKNKNEICLSQRFFNREHCVSLKDGLYCTAYFGFDVDTQKYSGAVHDLVYNTLFTGENALIFKYISEDNPIAYSYECAYEQYDNISNMNFNFEFAENKALESIACVISALNDLKEGRFNFDANLQFEISKWITILDDPNELNWNLAFYNHILQTEPVDYSDEKLGRYKNVTKEQIIDAVKDIFRRSNLTLVIEGKKRKFAKLDFDHILKKLND